VLYICFNKNISGYVQYQFEKEGISVVARTLHSVLAEDVDIEEPTSRYFEEILPDRFMNRSDIREYDYLVVDEGQDLFREAYIPCLGKMLKGGLRDGCWLIFYDQNQNLYNNNDQFNSSLELLKRYGAASYKLSVNCRNTKQIAAANVLTTGFSDIGRTKVNGISVKYVPYKDKQEEQQILKDILRTLKSEGICGSDLILLSRYAITNPSNCLYDISLDRNIGVLKTEGQIWKARKTDIRFSTVSSFKGLEAKTVVLMDVDGFTGQNQRLLNYVAISRACALLYILYDSGKEEDRQNMMIGDVLH
ncbi:MAG: ATP-binding domain-containing protein, partial [Bacteroides thetaiotaomicron]|nr:ATP-binding domain-containing protein [Bacteroides thetaiotaomicron]